MMQRSKLQKAAVISYAAVAGLFCLFFIYMGLFEGVSVEETREARTYHIVEHYLTEEIEDPSAPIGVRREYRWTMDNIGTENTTLAFYLVHHYAEVYFDNELVYSIMPKDTNRIGKSISSNWVIVPVYSSDSGKEVRVVVTPAYESVRSRQIEFKVGSLHSLYLAQLKRDLPQLILSAACILAGVFIMAVQLAMTWRRKLRNWDIFYLGNFTMILGLWKITDTRFSPFLFQGNTMVLGYVTIGALFLASIPFALYLKGRFSYCGTTPMLIVSLIASGTALIVLVCQVSGIADFRQLLPLAHAVIILLAVGLLIMVFSRKLRKKGVQSTRPWKFTLLLICGAFADLIVFYVKDSSSGLVFTLLAVLIYTLLLFASSLMEINRKVYIDAHTGLFNKNRWDALMNSHNPVSEPIGMMMLDLNQLKYVNDTMGHEAGDKMIFNFANILRNTIPATNTICRWGGDEFTVLITNAEQEIMEQYVEDIRAAVAAYNATGEKPALHYAVGYALSTEFPGISRKELLKKADARMYLDKNRWYAENKL